MKFDLRITPAAEGEVEWAKEFYAVQRPGLDLELAESLDHIFARITKTPLAFPIVSGSNIRKAAVKRFPFSIFFAVIENDIWVYSIFHNSRDPMIWRGRG